MANLKNTIIDDTGFIRFSSGTTAQRPNSPTAGSYRYNTDTNLAEYWDGSSWKNSEGKVIASTTGSVDSYTFDGYQIHRFLGTGSITFDYAGEIEYLVVAGGGGGGASDDFSGGGAGGGGGGVLAGFTNVTNGTYNITVGGGGTASAFQSRGRGGSGGDSSFTGTGVSLTAIGGGGGGGVGVREGANGGSGGGGARIGTGGSGIAGQGTNGGNGAGSTGGGSSAGGGGALTAGIAANATRQGDGGDGITSSIEGFPRAYAGGGGAGYNHSPFSGTAVNRGIGGIGGTPGGDYQTPDLYNGGRGIDGPVRSGAGGGGGSTANGATGGSSYGGGSGGSGIVVIRYKL